MILHQQLPHRKDSPLEPWFALHGESLTLFYCSTGKIGIIIQPLPPHEADPLVTSHPHTGQDRPAAIRAIQDHFAASQQTAIITGLFDQASPPPEWILLNSLDGTTPAIMHTVDPIFICMADRKTAILHPTEHFRSSVDLSVEGWTYWHEDAQSHFEKLTIEFCQATGIPIPARIAAAVRHT